MLYEVAGMTGTRGGNNSGMGGRNKRNPQSVAASHGGFRYLTGYMLGWRELNIPVFHVSFHKCESVQTFSPMPLFY